MALVFQVLSQNDKDEIYEFAEQRLSKTIDDENERRFALWSVRWRGEALDHYLKLGWSFVARSESAQNKVAGFFLAQPFLFFRGQTQTLWVEHIEARSEADAEALIDVAVRVAREKHLQRVLFAEGEKWRQPLARWNPSLLQDDIAEVKATKG